MKIKHLIVPSIALLLSTAFLKSATARPLSESEKVVDAQLQQVIKAAAGEGYDPFLPRTVSKLAQGAEAPKTILLNLDREYSFVAVCDQNCNDVDLVVRDMKGREVASDVSDDAVAVINLKPPSTGRYQVSVRMESCSARAYCNFGLGIFTKK